MPTPIKDLKSWRKAHNLSQVALAKLANISLETLRKVEAGKGKSRKETLVKLEKAMKAVEGKKRIGIEETYKFNTEEPAIFVYLYLPKMPDLQGALYDSLTDGFEYEKVASHFRSRKNKRELNTFFGRHLRALLTPVYQMLVL